MPAGLGRTLQTIALAVATAAFGTSRASAVDGVTIAIAQVDPRTGAYRSDASLDCVAGWCSLPIDLALDSGIAEYRILASAQPGYVCLAFEPLGDAPDVDRDRANPITIPIGAARTGRASVALGLAWRDPAQDANALLRQPVVRGVSPVMVRLEIVIGPSR